MHKYRYRLTMTYMSCMSNYALLADSHVGSKEHFEIQQVEIFHCFFQINRCAERFLNTSL